MEDLKHRWLNSVKQHPSTTVASDKTEQEQILVRVCRYSDRDSFLVGYVGESMARSYMLLDVLKQPKRKRCYASNVNGSLQSNHSRALSSVFQRIKNGRWGSMRDGGGMEEDKGKQDEAELCCLVLQLGLLQTMVPVYQYPGHNS